VSSAAKSEKCAANQASCAAKSESCAANKVSSAAKSVNCAANEANFRHKPTILFQFRHRKQLQNNKLVHTFP